MIIEKFGIRLLRLQEEHIELLRTWRNAEKIRRFMEFRDQITPEMQLRWFQSLDPVKDMYFMIEYQGQLVGMIHTSNINWQAGTGDAGLFIYNDELQSTHLPVLASLSMVDVMFGMFRLERLYAKVMEGNAVAERYNRNLGFEKMATPAASGFQLYELRNSKYWETTELLHLTAKKIGGEHFNVSFSKTFYDRALETNMFRESASDSYKGAIVILH